MLQVCEYFESTSLSPSETDVHFMSLKISAPFVSVIKCTSPKFFNKKYDDNLCKFIINGEGLAA